MARVGRGRNNMSYGKKKGGCTKVAGIVLGFIAIIVAVSAFGAFIAMLIAGGIAANHGWYSLGFGETWLWMLGLGIVGGAFHGSQVQALIKGLKQ